jgi:hypothetical protein
MTTRNESLKEGKNFSNETLRLKWYGLEQHTHSLVKVSRQHNDQLQIPCRERQFKSNLCQIPDDFGSHHFLPSMKIQTIRSGFTAMETKVFLSLSINMTGYANNSVANSEVLFNEGRIATTSGESDKRMVLVVY